jgi:hypothetical protein
MFGFVASVKNAEKGNVETAHYTQRTKRFTVTFHIQKATKAKQREANSPIFHLPALCLWETFLKPHA